MNQAPTGKCEFIQLCTLFTFQSCDGHAGIIGQGVNQPEDAQIFICDITRRVIEHFRQRAGTPQVQLTIGFAGAFGYAERANAMVVNDLVVERGAFALGGFSGLGRDFQGFDPVGEFRGEVERVLGRFGRCRQGVLIAFAAIRALFQQVKCSGAMLAVLTYWACATALAFQAIFSHVQGYALVVGAAR